MDVLIGCEFSGRVREAFRKRGHNAWSCDLLDTEIPGQHINGNVLDYVEGMYAFDCGKCEPLYMDPVKHFHDGRRCFFRKIKWDMAIFHPPCTHMSNVANRWRNRPGHYEARLRDREFFEACWNAPIPRICVENPQGDPNVFMREVYGVEYQTIHPYYFGGTERKRTNIWLKNLPPLQYDRNVQPPPPKYHISEGRKCAGKAVHFVESKGSNAKVRSRTFPEIAEAMAEQWG